MLRRLLTLWPFACRHTHVYRERRKLHGVEVMHWICEACGHAKPCVERSAKEHRQATKAAQVTARRVRKEPLSNVTHIERRKA